jgi:hypothetical protein
MFALGGAVFELFMAYGTLKSMCTRTVSGMGEQEVVCQEQTMTLITLVFVHLFFENA